MRRFSSALQLSSVVAVCAGALCVASVCTGCASAARASHAPSAIVAPVAPASKAQQRLMGTWAIELTPKEVRLVQIVKLALDDADRRPELAKMNATAEERNLYEDVVTLSSTFDPRLEQIERKMKRANTRLVVTPESVEFDSGDDTLDKDARYAVESENAEELVLRVVHDAAAHELVTVRFVDENTIAITLASENEPRRFVRRK